MTNYRACGKFDTTAVNYNACRYSINILTLVRNVPLSNIVEKSNFSCFFSSANVLRYYNCTILGKDVLWRLSMGFSTINLKFWKWIADFVYSNSLRLDKVGFIQIKTTTFTIWTLVLIFTIIISYHFSRMKLLKITYWMSPMTKSRLKRCIISKNHWLSVTELNHTVRSICHVVLIFCSSSELLPLQHTWSVNFRICS